MTYGQHETTRMGNNFIRIGIPDLKFREGLFLFFQRLLGGSTSAPLALSSAMSPSPRSWNQEEKREAGDLLDFRRHSRAFQSLWGEKLSK